MALPALAALLVKLHPRTVKSIVSNLNHSEQTSQKKNKNCILDC